MTVKGVSADRDTATGVDKASLARFHEMLVEWRNEGEIRVFPWRESSEPFEVLVGEVLLQRTRAANVVPVYESFLERWPTSSDLATADLNDVLAMVASLGLPQRAERLIELAGRLQELGDVPLDPSELVELPGIGPYVAHAVPIFAAERDLPLVDWVIARVLRRFFGTSEGRRPNADKELWCIASDLAAKGDARGLWLAVLDLADAVCTPKPRCDVCPLRYSCVFALN